MANNNLNEKLMQNQFNNNDVSPAMNSNNEEEDEIEIEMTEQEILEEFDALY